MSMSANSTPSALSADDAAFMSGVKDMMALMLQKDTDRSLAGVTSEQVNLHFHILRLGRNDCLFFFRFWIRFSKWKRLFVWTRWMSHPATKCWMFRILTSQIYQTIPQAQVDLTEEIIHLWKSKDLWYNEYVRVSEDNVRLEQDNLRANEECARLHEENKDLWEKLAALQVSRYPG